MTNINISNSPFSKTLDQLGNATSPKTNPNANAFGDLVKSSLNSAIDAQYKSEQVSAAALVGNADMTDVIQAINDAEVALNSVMAIRDKVISAYENIIHMAV